MQSPQFLQFAQTSVDTTWTKLNKPIGQTRTNLTRHQALLPTRANSSSGTQCRGRARSVKAAACGGLRTDVILCVFPQQRLNETWEKEVSFSLAAVTLFSQMLSSLLSSSNYHLLDCLWPVVCLGFLRKPSTLIWLEMSLIQRGSQVFDTAVRH